MISKKLKDLYSDQGELFAPILTAENVPYNSLGSYLDRYLYRKYRNIMILADMTTQDVYAWFKGVEYNFNCIYEALVKVYDPLSNYDMKEQSADGRSVSDSTTTTEQRGVLQHTETIADKQVSHYTTTDNSAASPGRLESYDVEEVTGTYASDSGIPVIRSKTEQIADEQGKKGIESKSKFDANKTASVGDLSVSANEVNTHELVRSGNIGVTTSQQMLQSEIDLRSVTNFFNIFGERFIEDCTTGMYGDYYAPQEEYIPWL